MSTSSARSMVKESLGWTIGLSVLMILAGCLAIIVAAGVGIVVALLVAWMLIFSGGAHIAFAWQSRTAGVFIWELLLGILYGVAGAYVLLQPVTGLASLMLALAVICSRKEFSNSSYRFSWARCPVRAG